MEAWTNPKKTVEMAPVVQALATYVERHPEHLPILMHATANAAALYPNADWGHLPYPQGGLVMQAIATQLPDVYAKTMPLQQSFDFF